MKKIELIESTRNARFKEWNSLKSARGLKKHGKTIIAGKSLVTELHEHLYEEPLEILFTEKMGLPFTPGPRSRAFMLKEALFKEIDPLGLSFPLLVAPFREPEFNPLVEAVEGVQVLLPLGDPKNLGAAIRNCLAFGVTKIILLKEAAHPYHAASIKASSGAVFKVSLEYGPSIHELRKSASLFCLDGGGQNLIHFQWPENVALLVGEEGQGVPAALRDPRQSLSIPIQSSIESLNAHQALGIALYDWYSKQHR